MYRKLKIPGHRNGERYTLIDMKKAAALRGGRCLSDKYFNVKTMLEWQCARGHRWPALAWSIVCGRWCPECARVRRKTIGEMRRAARSRGGKCLSAEYVNLVTALEWECRKGHRWTGFPHKILGGSWCPYCAGLRKSITDAQTLGRFRGGRCLSSEYVNARRPLEWECGKGHRWEAPYDAVRQGDWCPFCSGRRMTIRDMRREASKRGGRCLSDEYVNNHQHLVWECADKHRWHAAWGNIQRGKWCPECGRERTRRAVRRRWRTG